LSSPWALAVGAGSLWVADYDGDAIRRVDPRSRKVEGKPITVGDGPTAIAVADGVVWVVNDNDGFVSKVDAASGAVVGKEIRIPNGTRAGDTIAAGEGKVWVADGKGTIVPINAAGGKREPGIALPGRAKALEVAFGKGVLWILADDGTVMQMDASSRTPRDPVKVAARLAPDTGQLAVGEGAVWVAALDEGTVVRVDPAKQTHVPIPFPDGIDGDIAAGAGYVWVIDGARRLVQIDPSTNSVRSGSAGRFAPTYSGTTNDMTAGEGALWIADLGRDRVIRVVP
jgi:streptogramin lyase